MASLSISMQCPSVIFEVNLGLHTRQNKKTLFVASIKLQKLDCLGDPFLINVPESRGAIPVIWLTYCLYSTLLLPENTWYNRRNHGVQSSCFWAETAGINCQEGNVSTEQLSSGWWMRSSIFKHEDENDSPWDSSSHWLSVNIVFKGV